MVKKQSETMHEYYLPRCVHLLGIGEISNKQFQLDPHLPNQTQAEIALGTGVSRLSVSRIVACRRRQRGGHGGWKTERAVRLG
jgi:hypothetical protein